MKPLILLQNPWSPFYAGGTWPHASWMRALKASRSGQRLAILVNNDWDAFDFGNTTPIVAVDPSGVVPIDHEHMAKLVQGRPYIVGCGNQAHQALSIHWEGPAIYVPHPAYRVLTNQLFERARDIMNSRTFKRIALSQLRGAIHTEEIPCKQTHPQRQKRPPKSSASQPT